MSLAAALLHLDCLLTLLLPLLPPPPGVAGDPPNGAEAPKEDWAGARKGPAKKVKRHGFPKKTVFLKKIEYADPKHQIKKSDLALEEATEEEAEEEEEEGASRCPCTRR